MNKELIGALEALEKENGISKEVMFDTIEKSLLEEYKAQYKNTDNCRVELDRETGDFHIFSDRLVVADEELPEDSTEEGSRIALSKAQEVKPGCEAGETVTVELKAEGFTRTAAKTAKNTIIQKIREEEKNAIYNEYHAREKEIITGIVQRIDDRGNILVDIGKTQTILKVNDQVNGEHFNRGDRIKLLVVSVENKGKGGTQIRVSRNDKKLVERLFEEEVTEIKDGVVEIMGIAREAGSRTKMSVRSTDPNVDPVGACVGINGARVKSIVNELGDEQIDIINWDENPAQFIVNALSPAKVVSVMADEDDKKAQLVVADQQLSLAIGKAGQNVRLAAKLTGYGIDIKSESQMEELEAAEASEETAEDAGEEEELTFTEDLAETAEETTEDAEAAEQEQDDAQTQDGE